MRLTDCTDAQAGQHICCLHAIHQALARGGSLMSCQYRKHVYERAKRQIIHISRKIIRHLLVKIVKKIVI